MLSCPVLLCATASVYHTADWAKMQIIPSVAVDGLRSTVCKNYDFLRSQSHMRTYTDESHSN